MNDHEKERILHTVVYRIISYVPRFIIDGYLIELIEFIYQLKPKSKRFIYYIGLKIIEGCLSEKVNEI